MADWYYTEQGVRKGPVSEEQLQAFATLGQLKPTDLLWTKGMASWRAASEVAGFLTTRRHCRRFARHTMVRWRSAPTVKANP